MKILNIVGARADLVKIARLLTAMRSYDGITPILVHTDSIYDEKLSGIFFEQMGIPRPDIKVGVGSGSHAYQATEILKRIEPVLVEQNPDVVLVVGDVNSTMAASLAAAKFGRTGPGLSLSRDNEVNLLKIESRPIHGHPREYQFFLEVESDRTEQLAQALAEVRDSTTEILVVGLYTTGK